MIEKRLLDRITQLKSELDSLRPLPEAVTLKLKDQINLEWIYNSNAIEGSTLTLRETQLILEHGLTIGGKSLREHFEVINHREAINYVERLVERDSPITAYDIRQIHQLVLAKIDDASAGQYRQVAVRIAGAGHIPPESWQVPSLVDDLIRWLSSREALAVHAIARAAIAHHKFVEIHPFIDGNGRTGRLLLNLLLFKDGYPPAVIEKANRKQYYKVLSEADADHPKNLVNFVARACEHSLRLSVEASRVVTKKPSLAEQWISLAEATQSAPYSQEYLSLLARLGKLKAKKRGRNWVTTRAAIQEYLESKRNS